METNKTTQHEQLVAAGLKDLVLLPESQAFKDREASYWAVNAALHPACIVQPRKTEDVSRIVKALSKVDGLVALRSGGHTQWAESNNVHNGVTIDLGQMTDVTYDAETKLASIQPGPRWSDVYKELLIHQVCVTGGREGNVGIGGFLTGGGNSYYAGLHGLACDNVANFEVVLANGDIVNANANSHRDLWTALKGGSGNFGIVTRFDMYTFPAKNVWGGMRAAARSEGDKLAQAMVDFTNGNHKHPETAFIVLYIYNPGSSSEVLVVHVIVDTDGSADSPAFSDISKVPVLVDDVRERTMEDMAASYPLPRKQHQVWFSHTFKNDARIIKKAGEMHDELVADFKTLMPADDFMTQCLFQPLPTHFAEHSVRRGGNVLGLDKVTDNTLLWLITRSTRTSQQHEIMQEKVSAFSATLDDFGKSAGLSVDWQYLNYVDKTQNPLKSYGETNVDFIRQVAAKYDPSGIFQKKVVSGWNIANVSA